MPSCGVPGCTNRTGAKKSTAQVKFEEENGKITFHSLPSDGDRKARWMQAIGLQDQIKSLHHVCSVHFEETCFVDDISTSRRNLTKTAVPTIFKSNKRKVDSKNDSGPGSSKQPKPDDSLEHTAAERDLFLEEIVHELPYHPVEHIDSLENSVESIFSQQGGPSNDESLHLLPIDLHVEKCCHTPPVTCFQQTSTPKFFPGADSHKTMLFSPRASIFSALNFTANFQLPIGNEPLDLSKNATYFSPSAEIIDRQKRLQIKVVNPTSVLDFSAQTEPIDLTVKVHPLPRVKIEKRISGTPAIQTPVQTPPRPNHPTSASCTFSISIRPMPSTSSIHTSDDCTEPLMKLDELETTPQRRQYLQEKYPRKSRKKKLEYTPIKQKLNARLRKKTTRLRSLRQALRRKSYKLTKLQQILKELKDKKMMSSEDLEILKNSGGPHEELLVRQLSAVQKKLGGKTRVKRTYGKQIRSFALTLHFKSPSAYCYVRKVFKLALPHPKTIYKWYKVVDGNPGFTTESFTALQEKYKNTKGAIYGALSIDEMAIRRLIETDGKRYYGFVNMGQAIETPDDDQIAKECLTIMLVCINGSWKVPLGYFLTASATGLQKATLIIQCLRLLHQTKITVVTLTSDGVASNGAMYEELGCKLKDPDNLQTWFPNPVTESKIYVFLDNCHAIKLVRNTIGEKGIIYDENNNLIMWEHIKLLHELQETEGLHLANKLTSKHINFDKNKMKVVLATQVFSTSVADSLQTLMELKIEPFQNCQALIDFLRYFDKLFDIFNSKNMKQSYSKRPLYSGNIDDNELYLFLSKLYIKGLKLTLKNVEKNQMEDELIINSIRKTGFLGFIINIESILALYEDIVINGDLTFLPTYKLCQDHLEMFFGIIRSMGGFNNNPTARQFMSAFKKILIQMELQSSRYGNCVPIENISILTCSSRNPERVINSTMRKHNSHNNSFGNSEQLSKSDVSFSKVSNQTDEELDLFFTIDDEIADHYYGIAPTELSLIQQNICTHIAGFLVRRLSQVLECFECIEVLIEKPDLKRLRENCKLISVKDKGGLFYPSTDTCFIVEQCEKVIRTAYKQSTSFAMLPKYTPLKLTNIVVSSLQSSERYKFLFQNLEAHDLDHETLMDHKYHLIRSICFRFILLRVHHICKRAIEPAQSRRHVFNKLLLFRGQ